MNITLIGFIENEKKNVQFLFKTLLRIANIIEFNYKLKYNS